MKFKPKDIVTYYVRDWGQLKAQEYTVAITKVWGEHSFMKPPVFLFQGTVIGFGKNCENGRLNKFQSIVDSFEKIELKVDPNQIFKEILHA